MEKKFDLRYCNMYPNNTLTDGFAPKDLGTNPKSLPQYIQERGFIRGVENELNMLSAIQGYHAAVKSRMEHDLVSKAQRHPGIPSSNLGLDLLMGLDDTIEVSDVLGTEKPTNPLGKKTVNDALESIFNINS